MKYIENAIIEIPMKTKNKFEIDKNTGRIKLDRVLYSAMNYYFIEAKINEKYDTPFTKIINTMFYIPNSIESFLRNQHFQDVLYLLELLDTCI